MAVPANTSQTYAYTSIREDLSDVVSKISPTETPVMTAIGDEDAESTYNEWLTIDLAAASGANAVIEGDDVANDAPTSPVRLGNYVQLMDKVKGVSSTQNAVKHAGNVAKMAKQILYAAQELKRDMETRICSNSPAVAGGASTARETAGFGAFIRTNDSRGAGGADPTLSGTTSGYPNAAPTNGTQRAFTETLLKDVVQLAWEAGGEPSMVIVSAFNKRTASSFTGNATRFKKAEDKKIVAGIDVYESDFGELQLVPNRFTTARQALVIDPSKASIAWLQRMRNEDLAKTGHADRRMIFCEWALKVDNEKAHGIVADLTTS